MQLLLEFDAQKQNTNVHISDSLTYENKADSTNQTCRNQT